MANYTGAASVRSYIARTDLVDTVIADNVNSLQEEVNAIETVLGSVATSNSPLVSTFSGSWSTSTTTWGTLGARLLNIESGLVNGVGASAPYVTKSGGSTITTSSNKGLVLTTGTGSLNLFESYSSGAVLGFNLDSSGTPKVGSANVLYVGSSDYNTLNTAASGATTAAASKIPLATVTAVGDLIVGTGSATVTRLGIGGAGTALVSTGTTASWATPTDTTKIPLSTVTTAGDLILGSGNGTVSRLAAGSTSGFVLTSNGSGVAPSWQAVPSAYVSQTNGTVSTASISSGVVRNVHTKTVTPTGTDGAVGDIWIVYA
jgi:hypothetical protein